ncbi:MAG: SRPBCC family protein [Gemmatimonadetes bacterium]|nr:SRPBCC family protein [Gemmatimonadota bacterium]
MPSTTHDTFSLERTYPAPPARVFAAWSDRDAKARWFACHAEYTLDFRVGGGELTRGGEPGGPVFSTETRFHDIVPERRIVYTYALHRDATLVSVAIVTVELAPAGTGTRLVLTEQGTYPDGHMAPEQIRTGTADALRRLDAELAGTPGE